MLRPSRALAGGNRHGYAGYEFEPVTSYALWNVRHRLLNSDWGRWLARDPLTSTVASRLYSYVDGAPVGAYDPTGMALRAISSIEYPNSYNFCGELHCFAEFEYIGSPLRETHYAVQLAEEHGTCTLCTGANDSFRIALWEGSPESVPPNVTYYKLPIYDHFSFKARDKCKADRAMKGVMALIPGSAFTQEPIWPAQSTARNVPGNCCGDPNGVVWTGLWYDDNNLPFNPWAWDASPHKAMHTCHSVHNCCGCERTDCTTTHVRDCIPGPGATCPPTRLPPLV